MILCCMSTEAKTESLSSDSFHTSVLKFLFVTSLLQVTKCWWWNCQNVYPSFRRCRLPVKLNSYIGNFSMSFLGNFNDFLLYLKNTKISSHYGTSVPFYKLKYERRKCCNQTYIFAISPSMCLFTIQWKMPSKKWDVAYFLIFFPSFVNSLHHGVLNASWKQKKMASIDK